MKKLNLNITINNSINFMVLIVMTIYILNYWNVEVVGYEWTKIISIISILILIYQIIMMKRFKVKFNSFIFVFNTLNYLFVFGRVYLRALNLDSNIGWDLLSYYPSEYSYKGALFALVYIQSIYSGMIAISPKRKNKPVITGNILYKSGIMMSIIGLLCKVYVDYIQISTQVEMSGYVAVADNVNGVAQALSNLFVVGIIYIISSKKITNKKLIFLLSVYMTYSISIIIFSGDRRYTIVAIIAIILCYIFTYDIKISVRKLSFLFIVGMLMLAFLSAVRKGRADVITSLSDFWNIYKVELFEDNIFYQTLNEFGLTFFTYTLAIKNFPNIIGYQYGMSFLGALPNILPGAGRLFPQILDNTSIIKMTYAIDQQGLGGSLGQDLYANFGLYGILFAFIAGILITYIIKKPEKSNNVSIAKYYSMFYILLNLVRANFGEIIRSLVYIFIFSSVLILIFTNIENKKNEIR